MSRVTQLIGELGDRSTPRPGVSKLGVRMVISLSDQSNKRLVDLAQVLDVPSGVLAGRLLAVALLDAEERACDLDLYDRG